jgi:pectate lyase
VTLAPADVDSEALTRAIRSAAACVMAAMCVLAGCGGGRDVLLGGKLDSVDDGGGLPEGSVSGDGSGGDCDAIPALQLALLDEAEGVSRRRTGFGERATGGRDGCLYRVTTLADKGAGSLREGLEQDGALWIVFEVDGDIMLDSNLHPRSNKTIDAGGSDITIKNYGLTIDGRENLIIENLAFEGNLEVDDSDDADAITIRNSSVVWIDRCEFSPYRDGLIDVIEGSTDVTVSWSKFSEHNRVMLLGASASDTEDQDMRVTLHHNWFYQTEQYNPRIRFGRVHMYNNLLDGWKSYGAAASYYSQLYSEQNVYIVAESHRAITITPSRSEPEDSGFVLSDADRFLDCPLPQPDDDFCDEPISDAISDPVFDPRREYEFFPQPVDSLLNDIYRAGRCLPAVCPER